MTSDPQRTFEFFPGMQVPPELAPGPGAAPTLPSPLIGEADVKRLQAEGWCFSTRGIRLGNCYSCWASKGEEQNVFFLADPEKYPEAWSQEEKDKVHN